MKRAARLRTGLPEIDGPLKGGLPIGFTVLYGPEEIHITSHSLSVRAQLPKRKGGLETSSIFIDGGNNFDPYLISDFARELDIVPEKALRNIYVSRAFTCYQLVDLLLERLTPAVRDHSSRFVVISSFPELFYDRDADTKEAHVLVRRSVMKVRRLAHRLDAVVLATVPTYFAPPRRKEGVLRRILEGADYLIRVGAGRAISVEPR
ncbi:MAG: hypothetical protein ACE5OY_07815 [Candidatus Bathyarchaeia archaeon]